MIYVAKYCTRHHDFEAVGKSEREAHEALLRGMDTHALDRGLEGDWYDPEAVAVVGMEVGKTYRDGEEV